MRKLYEIFCIQLFQISFMLTTTGAKVTFGGIDTTQKEERHYHKQVDSKTWDVGVNDIKIGSTSIYSKKVQRASLDTFFKVITLPPDDFTNFANYI